jgi:hypothetical protein
MTAIAQEGHPLRGSWRGDWGPSATHRNPVVLVLDWNGTNITGVVNPGPTSSALKVARLDITPGTPARQAVAAQGNTPAQPAVAAVPPVFRVHFEFDVRDRTGNTLTYTVDGTLEDVELPSRSLVGTWNHGNVRGDFRVRRF